LEAKTVSPQGKSPPRRLIRRAELKRRVPFSLVHIWRLEQLPSEEDPFPKRIVIGPNSVAWDEAAVDAWLERRIRAARKIKSPRKSAVVAGGE
jgi:predicted DNA-binding transcriptional regulator AlpA